MSNKQFIDPVCIISSLLFLVSNAIDVANKFSISDRFNWSSWKKLDVAYIKNDWDFRHHNSALDTFTGLLGALGWFVLCIPIIETSWFLSKGGKKRTASHAIVCILAIGSSLMELIARLMLVGLIGTSEYVSNNFALDDWEGWKTLEITFTALRGLLTWVDAFEYFALFLILSLIGVSVLRENREDNSGSFIFDRKWAQFGIIIAFVSLLEFAADIQRHVHWSSFAKFAGLYLSIINSVVFLPFWLLFLGLQLPVVRREFESSAEEISSQQADDIRTNEVPPESTEKNFNPDLVSQGELS